MQTDVDFAKKEAIIRIKNSAVARQITAKEPVCHLIRGYINGVYHSVFGTSAVCAETKCMAKGDPVCEFHAKTCNLANLA
jgi:predicted hydrocarbon binding protein